MLDPGEAAAAADRYVADLQRRLFGAAFQRAEADQFGATCIRLSLAWVTRYGSTPGLTIKSTPLLVNGVLYFTAPNNVWAADARTGRELWHYTYPPGRAARSATAEWGCTATGCSLKRRTATW